MAITDREHWAYMQSLDDQLNQGGSVSNANMPNPEQNVATPELLAQRQASNYYNQYGDAPFVYNGEVPGWTKTQQGTDVNTGASRALRVMSTHNSAERTHKTRKGEALWELQIGRNFIIRLSTNADGVAQAGVGGTVDVWPYRTLTATQAQTPNIPLSGVHLRCYIKI